ncbi:hypothetical protein GCK32_004293, partial [Trichostrongylus colubriformis]
QKLQRKVRRCASKILPKEESNPVEPRSRTTPLSTVWSFLHQWLHKQVLIVADREILGSPVLEAQKDQFRTSTYGYSLLLFCCLSWVLVLRLFLPSIMLLFCE